LNETPIQQVVDILVLVGDIIHWAQGSFKHWFFDYVSDQFKARTYAEAPVLGIPLCLKLGLIANFPKGEKGKVSIEEKDFLIREEKYFFLLHTPNKLRLFA
jgi:hypothetical protein